MVKETIRVLIIDDDVEDADLAVIALRRAGSPTYVHQHANCMSHAFDALDLGDFDIVLLDLGLPGSNGVETLERFRNRYDSIPVIVLSGLDDELVATQTLDRGAQDYLLKNEINARTLSRAIRYAIHRQSIILENRKLLSRVRENEDVLKSKNRRLKNLYDTAHSFVDNVSHEFRTPLTVIKEYVSLVRDGVMGDVTEEQARFLRIADDRADDLNTMVDDMLDVSKLEAGMLHVRRESHDIEQVVSRVLPALSRKAAVRNLELEVQISDELPLVYCDSEKTERVIVNLVVNAMKFTRPGGRIRVWALAEESEVVVGVTDNGPGIAPDCLRLIFDRFKQVDIDIRSSTKGFGLGLNIARELVSLNLGEMRAQSEVGVGSTFSFVVPVDDPIEVTERFLAKRKRAGGEFMSLVTGTIDPGAPVDQAAEVLAFLNHLVRGNELSFQGVRGKWILLLPEPESEAIQFISRANQELDAANRNRPKGAMANVTFNIDAAWSDLSCNAEEIIGRISTHLREGEEVYV